MSLRALSWAMNDAPVETATEKLVLLALADDADDDGFCWPSVRRLGDKALLSTGGVRRALERLEAAGLVRSRRPQVPAPGRSSRYVVGLGRPVEDLEALLDDRTSTARLARSSARPSARSSRGENCAQLRAPERAELRATARPGARIPVDPPLENNAPPLPLDVSATRAAATRAKLRTPR